VKCGEIHWAKPDPAVGPEQAGRQPVLIVSSDDAIAAIPSVVTTIPLTTRERGWATHVRVEGADTGLDEPSWALCEQVRTISVQRIGGRVGIADGVTMTSVRRVLGYLLNM
jgi:mRNA interferase MazF